MAHTCRIRLKGSAVADLKFFASPRVGCGAAPPGERFCYDREGVRASWSESTSHFRDDGPPESETLGVLARLRLAKLWARSARV